MTLVDTPLTPDDGNMPSRISLPESVIEQMKRLGAVEIEAGDGGDRRNGSAHLSYSQIATYLRCSMQYWFKYVMKEKDKAKVSLAIGKGGHAALEKNMKRKIKSGSDSPTEEVVQWASDFMDKELSAMPPSEYEKDVEPGELKDKYLAATRVFQTRDAPKITPIAAEMAFTLDINEYQPDQLDEPIRPVIGFIDTLSVDSNTMVTQHQGMAKVAVEDYKFVTRKRTQAEVNTSPQLSLYAAVHKKVTGLWPTRLGYRMFTPGNSKDGPDATPLLREPQHMTPDALAARLRRLAFQFRKVEEGIRAGVFIPTDDPISCSWCPVRDRCQASLVDDFEAASIRAKTEPK